METSSEKHRTTQQNRAIHQYLRELSAALNDAGYDFRMVMKEDAEIPWDSDGVMAKTWLWKTVQKAMGKPESTKDLEPHEVSEIYNVLDRHIASKFGIHIEFPSDERMAMEQLVRAENGV